MKKIDKLKYVGLALLAVMGGTSCTTTYDAQGRPVETVDPAAAAVGALAIGALGYAIGHNNSDDYYRHHKHHKHYKHHPHHGHHNRHKRYR